jgi:hypothetical protein
MHNSFYASGFLFHPSSRQILLQQDSQEQPKPEWSLFSTAGTESMSPAEAFHRMLCDTLGITLKKEACLPIYDYLHKEHRVPHYIFYAEVDEVYDEESLLTENKTAWFQFRQIIKLPMQKQCRQDITVGQRVIDLALRELLPTT